MNECRICLEIGDINDLISPCNCSGTSKWVHQQCLQRWRAYNINSDYYDKCEICLFNYIISKKGKLETYIFDIEKYRVSILEIILSLVFTYLIGNLLWLADMETNYLSVDICGMRKIWKEFELEKDTWYNWVFYQGLAAFILNMVFYLIFNIRAFFRVHNKKKYFQRMLFYNVNMLLYTSNFPILLAISQSTNSSNIIGYWSPLFVSFHFTLHFKYIFKSNKILKRINYERPDDIIHSFQYNPLNEFTPLRIESDVN